MQPSFFALLGKRISKICASLIVVTTIFIVAGEAIAFGQSACDSAAGTVRQAHEKLLTSPSAEDLAQILQELKYATDECPDNGDAWYYRAKVEEKLGKPSKYSMDNARRYQSPALKNGVNPFGSSAPANPPANPGPASNVRDTAPPQIRIISPLVVRGQGVVPGSRVTVTGEATDESGVSEVTVRGQPARLDAGGKFSAEVMLKVGDNQIAVTATDIHGNRAEQSFAIKRDATLAGGPPDKTNALPVTGSYYALLVGVEKYQDKRIPQLDHPINDTRRLAKALTTRYTFDAGKITTLANPNRRELLNTFKELRGKLTADDLLLIFYAGHGDWSADKDQGYWLPSDADLDSSAQWFSNSDLRDEVKGIKASHILLISDACFSGGLFNERAIPKEAPVAIREIFKLPSRKAITSGALKTVPDKSVFIEYLLKRLEENQDDFLPALRLFANMREAVINNSPNQQTPIYGTIQGAGDEGGDFVLMRRR